MNRIQKRFLQKVSKPFIVTAAVLGVGTVTHFVVTLFGYTLLHVLMALIYIGGGILFFAPFVILLTEALGNKWQEAKREIEQENKQIIKAISK